MRMDIVTLSLGVDEHNDLLVPNLGDLILKPGKRQKEQNVRCVVWSQKSKSGKSPKLRLHEVFVSVSNLSSRYRPEEETPYSSNVHQEA